jgi:hypothetical protein
MARAVVVRRVAGGSAIRDITAAVSNSSRRTASTSTLTSHKAPIRATATSAGVASARMVDADAEQSKQVPSPPLPSPATTKIIHYGALPSDRKITAEHVHQCIGLQSSRLSTNEVEQIIKEWTELKLDARAYASQFVKKRMVQVLRDIRNDAVKCLGSEFEGWVARLSCGKEVSSYEGIRKWIKTEGGDDGNQIAIKHIFYRHWDLNPGWVFECEKAYMAFRSIEYCKTSEQTENEKCFKNRPSYEKWGCLAHNIFEVKGELVKNLKKIAKNSAHGVVVSKSRTHEEAYDDQGRYKRRKKEDFIITIHEKDMKQDVRICLHVIFADVLANCFSCYSPKISLVFLSYAGRQRYDARRKDLLVIIFV